MRKTDLNSIVNIPLISVITLSYYSEDLYATILSVLEQTYEKLQYILIDDGTSPFSVKDIEKFIEKNKRENLLDFCILHNQDNLGTVRSANLAFSYAGGEYLFYLSGDDLFYDKDVLSEWVLEFQKRKALFLTGLRAVHDDMQKSPLCILPTAEQIALLKKEQPIELFEELCKENFIFGCCTARSKEAIEQFGLYDETYRLVEDYPLNLRITRSNVNIEIWERIVIKYKTGGSSSPARFNKIYEKDSDTCFKKEILPYTQHPYKSSYHYYRWKYRHKRNGAFERQIQKYQYNTVMKLCVYLFYPLHALRVLKHYLYSHKRRL